MDDFQCRWAITKDFLDRGWEADFYAIIKRLDAPKGRTVVHFTSCFMLYLLLALQPVLLPAFVPFPAVLVFFSLSPFSLIQSGTEHLH